MPVEEGVKVNLRSALAVGIAGVVAGLGLFVLVLVLSQSGGVEPQLGDDVFEVDSTENLAGEIERNGPILLSDLAGGTRDIYLQHLGDDHTKGWLAFAAQRPGAPRQCAVAWSGVDGVFVDPCDGSTIPADGEGLRAYDVYLEDGGERLVVDINAVRATTTTA